MTPNQTQASEAQCYCGNTAEYSSCCGAYLDGFEIPQTAEQLMRSRYCGFVLRNEAYLLATWHPTTRPSRVRMDEQQNWLGLRIRSIEKGGGEDSTGNVEFVARFKIAGKGHRLHELSRFEKIDGRWFYLDGKHL
jgi:SEC-C motif-containing protein